ncbi:hypothetical protein GPJ56_000701 [Histomonas meleagridis]|uniref:uncharacterized protein n=1 Tax=Histomonas meleagridis TaxID=135588 RepID=UPI00355AC5A1|nr:hypothetical protein GPJ56_000701 [Histomonas meleagridis]KAH0804540.1 hypothetical protein GO595_003370 [Histomonas meleagridis]
MLREWDAIEVCYKYDEYNELSEAKKIGDEMLHECLNQKYLENMPYIPSTGIITQKSLFSFCSSQEDLSKAIVPLNYNSERCVDVTNEEEEEIHGWGWEPPAKPIIEEQD